MLFCNMDVKQIKLRRVYARILRIIKSKPFLITSSVLLLLLALSFLTVQGLKGRLSPDMFTPDIFTSSEIVPAPIVNDQILGYWSSQGVSMASSELNDAKEMKEMGINTITFSPSLSHTQEGKVIESSYTQAQVKNTINKAHKAGFRVFLETTPMNAGEVDPKVTDVKLFQSEMTKVAVKYAAIAEEYNVAYFAPIVEPAHHMSVEEADVWLQELLPKLRKVYSGKIMWKKQSMHLTNVKEFPEDHIMELGFKKDNSIMNLKVKSQMDHGVTLFIGGSLIGISEYAGGEELFARTETVSFDQSKWHTLRIEVEGKMIRIFLDGDLLIEHEDDSGPMGGYTIASGNLRINKLEITSTAGERLFTETFETLNNWNEQRVMTLENKELVLSEAKEVKLIHDVDYSGYDYIAIDTFKRGRVQTNQEYLDFLEYVIDKTNDQAVSDGVPNVIIAEFGGSIMEVIGWIDVDERAKIPMTEAEMAQVTNMVLVMAQDKVDGFIYNGWDIEGQGLNRMPLVKEVIKKWYTSH